MTTDISFEDLGRAPEARASARAQDALLSEMELPLRRTFFPLGYSVEIVTNDTLVLQAAQESFGHRDPVRFCGIPAVRVGVSPADACGAPPEPIRRQYNHLYSLGADTDNQALLDLRSCTSFMWATRNAVRNRLYFRYNFLEKVVYLLLGASVVTDLHAACVGRGGRSILLCGDSGAGKSTLAYACARRGWTYTSDDTSYLVNSSAIPRVIGHAHRARFRPSARELFPELEAFSLTPRMEGKPSIEVSTAELPIKRVSVEARVYSVVYLRRDPAAKAQLTRLPAGTAAKFIAREMFSAGEIRARHVANLQLLAGVPTYELHYFELNDAVEVLERLTEKE